MTDALYDVTFKLPWLDFPVTESARPGSVLAAYVRRLARKGRLVAIEARDLSTGSLFIFRPRVRG